MRRKDYRHRILITFTMCKGYNCHLLFKSRGIINLLGPMKFITLIVIVILLYCDLLNKILFHLRQLKDLTSKTTCRNSLYMQFLRYVLCQNKTSTLPVNMKFRYYSRYWKWKLLTFEIYWRKSFVWWHFSNHRWKQKYVLKYEGFFESVDCISVKIFHRHRQHILWHFSERETRGLKPRRSTERVNYKHYKDSLRTNQGLKKQ